MGSSDAGIAEKIEQFNVLRGENAQASKDFAESLKTGNAALSEYLSHITNGSASMEGYNKSAAKAAATQAMGTTATALSTTSWKALTASVWENIKAMASWMVSNPLGWIMLAVTAISAVVSIFDALTTSTEEWEEMLAETKEELSDLQTEAAELNSELDTTQQRMDELLNKGTLTLTEEEELERLRAESAELQRQIELNRIKQDETAKKAAEEFSGAMESDMEDKYASPYPEEHYEGSSELDDPTSDLFYIDEQAYIEEKFRHLKELRDEYSRTEDESLKDTIKNAEEYLQGKMDDFSTRAEGLEYYTGDNLEDWQKESNQWLDYINQFNDQYLLVMGDTQAANSVWQSIWSRDQFSGAHDAIQQLRDEGKLTAESLGNLYKDNADVKTFVDYLNDIGAITIDANGDGKQSAEELSAAFGQVVNQVKQLDDVTPTVKTFSETLGTLSDMEAITGSLSDALGEFQDEGRISTDTLSSLLESFGNIPDAEKHITALGNASNIEQAQKAVQSLASAYLYSSGILDQVDASNKQLIVTRLQAIGVANAQELVEGGLIARSMGLTDATAAEVNEILKTSTAADSAQKALAAYAYNKEVTRLSSIGFKNATEDEIAALQGLAKQAGITGSKIVALQRLQALQREREALYEASQGYPSTVIDFQLAQNQKEIDQVIKELEKLEDIPIEIPASSSSTPADSLNTPTNPQDTSTNSQENAIRKAFSDLEHQHNMGLISEAAYLDKLEQLNNRYYKNNAEYESEYQSNLEQIRNGRLQLTRDLFAGEQAELQRQRDRGKISEWEYLNELEKLDEKYYKDRQDFLEDSLQVEDEILQGRLSLYQEAYDQLGELVDKQAEKIRSEKEAEKQALQEQLDALKEYYDQRKQELRDEAEQEDNLQNEAEMKQTISGLERRVNSLRLSTSAVDVRRRLELEQELADAREELEEFQEERRLEEAEKALDEEYEKEAEKLQSQIDTIDEYLENEYQVQQDALNELKQIKDFSRQSALYQRMRDWNRTEGTGKDEDIDQLFSNVQNILTALGTGTFGGAMSFLKGQVDAGQHSFAGGTTGAPRGFAVVDELGYEAKLVNPRRGRYQFLNDGDVVFTRRESLLLKQLTGSAGATLIGQRLAGMLQQGAQAASSLLRPAVALPVAIQTGDIVINGNADNRTVAALKAAQKSMTYQILKEFKKLK